MQESITCTYSALRADFDYNDSERPVQNLYPLQVCDEVFLSGQYENKMQFKCSLWQNSYTLLYQILLSYYYNNRYRPLPTVTKIQTEQ